MQLSSQVIPFTSIKTAKQVRAAFNSKAWGIAKEFMKQVEDMDSRFNTDCVKPGPHVRFPRLFAIKNEALLLSCVILYFENINAH